MPSIRILEFTHSPKLKRIAKEHKNLLSLRKKCRVIKTLEFRSDYWPHKKYRFKVFAEDNILIKNKKFLIN